MTQAAPEVYTETITPLQGGDSISFRMIKVEGGEFDMGAEDRDRDALDRERPKHRVKLSTFWIAEFPVTQALWVAVMGDNPAYFPGMDRPVEQVSWLDITERFLPALNHQSKQSYRLPTEAEWEYAARNGIHQSKYQYAGSNRLQDVATYRLNPCCLFWKEMKKRALRLKKCRSILEIKEMPLSLIKKQQIRIKKCPTSQTSFEPPN